MIRGETSEPGPFNSERVAMRIQFPIAKRYIWLWHFSTLNLSDGIFSIRFAKGSYLGLAVLAQFTGPWVMHKMNQVALKALE